MRNGLAALASLAATTVLACTPALALTRVELKDVGFHLQPGAELPKAAVLHGPHGDLTLGAALDGKPALVTFTDYRCESLCGVILDQLAGTLPKVPLAMGRDFNVISVSLSGTQTQADAASFRDAHTGGSALHDAALFLTNDRPALEAMKASVGLVAPFDEEHKQFAHPAGLMLVDAAGRVQRVLSPFAMNPLDLKLALTESGAAPASLTSHLLLLCYGFNPAAGIYTLRIERVMAVAAAVTIALIAAGVGTLLLVERRRRRAVPLA